MSDSREQFKSRLGFILIAAGCAVGIGNVWRFPYITGQYGGAIFVLIYIAFLLAMGIPLLTVELAIGRASKASIAMCYDNLEAPNSKWHYNKWWQLAGNYILLSFYGIITGWMLYYFLRFAFGTVPHNLPKEEAIATFTGILSDPVILFTCMATVVVVSCMIVAMGLVKGVERYTKPLMILLIVLLIFMAIRSCTMSGFADGISFYLKPDLSKLENHLGEAIWAAMGQAFFTLSTGMGGIAIFGSYMSDHHRLLNEAWFIAFLDTAIALLAGFVIFPACFTYGINPDAGPNLLFVSMTSVFSNMTLGSVWGTLFFLFMLIAAVSTLIAVFENIIAANLEMFSITRKKAVLVNCLIILVASVLPVLGFNILSNVSILGHGTGITDFFDFLVSNNILPIGSLVFVLFVTSKSGMKWERYIEECNKGIGFRVSYKLYTYYRYILASAIAVILVIGYLQVFNIDLF